MYDARLTVERSYDGVDRKLVILGCGSNGASPLAGRRDNQNSEGCWQHRDRAKHDCAHQVKQCEQCANAKKQRNTASKLAESCSRELRPLVLETVRSAICGGHEHILYACAENKGAALGTRCEFLLTKFPELR